MRIGNEFNNRLHNVTTVIFHVQLMLSYTEQWSIYKIKQVIFTVDEIINQLII